MGTRQIIERAIEIFPEHKKSSNDELVAALVSRGISQDIAWKILDFAPLAFCRVMLRILDVNGEAVELVYDPDNSTQTVKNVFGNETFYEYDERGNIVQEIDPVGLKTVRTYDGDNNLLTETIFTPESEPDGWTTEWTYDGNGNQLTKTDELGNITRWSYNQWGQMLTETDPLGQATSYLYDDRGNLLSSKDAADNVTEYRYDSRGNLRLLIDAADNETEFRYDEVGRLEETIYPDETDSLEVFVDAIAPGETPATIDWTTVVYPKETPTYLGDNPRSFTEYYQTGQTKASIDPRGYRTESRYDELNRLIEIIYPDETPDDLEDNPRTSYGYDKAGRQTTQTDALNQTTTTVFNSLGQVEKTQKC